MASIVEAFGSRDALSTVLDRVRTQWRLRLAMHSSAIVVGVAAVLILGGAVALKLLHFTAGALFGIRLACYATLAAVVVVCVIRLWRRRTSDAQVALYYEERNPSPGQIVLNAMHVMSSDAPASVRSPSFVGRVLEAAVARVRASGNGYGIERQSVTQALAMIGATVVVTALLLVFGPSYLRTGALLMVAPRADVRAHMFVAVQPGNAKVGRGGEQMVRAQSRGFSARRATIVVRRGQGASEHIPMTVIADSAGFKVRLVHLTERTSYYIDADGVRSPLYYLDIVNLPSVSAMALEYHYPAYTGLPVKVVDKAGDISALKGTSVVVHATTTMPVRGGWINVEGGPKVRMTPDANGILTGTIQVTRSGFYKVELDGPNGDPVTGSSSYAIDAVDDQEPTVEIVEPGKDLNAEPLEEVSVKVRAEDDYGVAKVAMKYSVNGGPEQTVALSPGKPLKEVTASHTFALEDLHVKPGDLVSYYAQTADNDAAHEVVKSDIYFMTVRPFGYKYTRSPPSRPEKGKPEKQQNKKREPTLGVLAQKQRNIIAGSFKIEHQPAKTPENVVADNLTTLRASQKNLTLDVRTLLTTMKQRQVAGGQMKTVADELAQALSEMESTDSLFTRKGLHTSLGPQQRALQHLQRAEAAYRERKTPSKSTGEGKPPEETPEEQATPEELADMFEIMKSQLSNSVETKSQSSSPQSSAGSAAKQVDTLAEKLKALAARKQNQDLKKDSKESQEEDKKLAESVENAADRLQKLSDEQPNNDSLRKAAKLLREVANDMKKGAAAGDKKLMDQAAKKMEQVRKMLGKENGGGNQTSQPKALAQADKLVKSAEAVKNALSESKQSGIPTTDQKKGQGKDGKSQGKDGKGQAKGKDGKGQGKEKSESRQGGGGEEGGDKPDNISSTVGRSVTAELAAQMRQQLEGAEAVKHELNPQGEQAKALEKIIEKMRNAQAMPPWQALQVQSEILDGLKVWEFKLRSQLEGESKHPQLGGTKDAPREYQTQVDEYFRSLGKARPAGG